MLLGCAIHSTSQGPRQIEHGYQFAVAGGTNGLVVMGNVKVRTATYGACKHWRLFLLRYYTPAKVLKTRFGNDPDMSSWMSVTGCGDIGCLATILIKCSCRLFSIATFM